MEILFFSNDYFSILEQTIVLGRSDFCVSENLTHYLPDNPPQMIQACILSYNTAQKMKFSIKDFFSKCDQIRSYLRIWSYLLKKCLMENFSFCAV